MRFKYAIHLVFGQKWLSYIRNGLSLRFQTKTGTNDVGVLIHIRYRDVQHFAVSAVFFDLSAAATVILVKSFHPFELKIPKLTW